MRLDRAGIDALERRRRAALINSLGGLRGAMLVGTADREGATNLAIFSSLTHIGAAPPLQGLIFRPDSVERHTLENLRASGVYTVNHVTRPLLRAAHQTSARYPREVSEFGATGLGEHWIEGFNAPFVAEAVVRIGLRLVEEIPIRLNGTHLVIGSIEHLEVPADAVTETGTLNPERAGSIAVAGLDTYFTAEAIERRSYAHPGDTARETDTS